jgi:hypothetical protein
MDWVAPAGPLCDAARPGWIVYEQGDGRIGIHDWGMEFTAAGRVRQAELLLISRDQQAIAETKEMTGQELLETGLPVALSDARSAAVIVYQRTK